MKQNETLEMPESQICPSCAGRTVIAIGTKTKCCPQCQGEGMLFMDTRDRINHYPAKSAYPVQATRN